MSTTTQLTQDLLAGVPEGRRVQYVRDWLKDFDKEVSAKREMIAQFRQWLEQLSDESITRSYQQHYNPTYLNLSSVFGEELPFEKIHSLTIDCIKTKLWDECEFFFRLSELLDSIKSVRNEKEFTTDQSLLRLKGWDSGLLRSLLSHGKGLIICSFRFGAIRYVPIELALLGFPILQVVNKPAFEAMQAAFASLSAHGDDKTSFPTEGPKLRLLKTVDAEAALCTVELVNALKRNEIIGMCIEGNTGSDGPWGNTSKSRIDFLGHPILAKNGAARLAAALRTPILPLIALTDGDTSGELFFSEPIIPPAGLKRSAVEEFVRTSTQSLYALFESYVRQYPQQWEGWSALHRWRECDDVAANDSASDNVDPKEISQLLGDARRFRINPRRVAQLPTKDGVMWVDLRTLKGFQNPKWAEPENLLAILSKPEGLDLTWIDNTSRDPEWKEKLCVLLAYLRESGLVTAY
jgi:lauroyl/myristoyl acyltransferase